MLLLVLLLLAPTLAHALQENATEKYYVVKFVSLKE